MKRTLVALVSVVALAGGLSACGSEPTDTPSESTAETSADTNADTNAESAATSATESASQESGAEATDGEVSESVELKTADGTVTLVPADFKAAIDEVVGEWGDPETIQQDAHGALASFKEGNLLAWAQESGAAPLVGKIAETWANDGGLNNTIGLPTGPEEEIDGGWTQTFTNGVINWVQNNGKWEAEIEQN
ncbi:hypothetical protein QP027_03680 [Corynebacterium breve]|uniref:Secreted protein n=1 Tax=Corynebacterium breve TaxID=3049799 RepID=A0ABY8VHG2_9CORY|nr:hypothetical protein [Corynebacterium breve]WIM68507.1 hypothetical protein QP027_03680 [Corynebacterium breve]